VRLDEAGVARSDVEAERAAAQREHADLCARLTVARTAAAARLDREMRDILPGLGMPDARFRTVLSPIEPGAAGAESAEFHVSVNAGFDPGPIARIASGGELARIMLALKATLAREDRVPTLVFDEIDAGIGGRAAQHVALRLRDVARHHQVIVVTHLAAIAAHADHHYYVEKSERDGMAATLVRELHGDDRVSEIARLLGGDPDSRVSLEHARELIRLSAADNAAAAAPSGRSRARR
jgi:DNA repair protein RecN (Recombination protein N)